MFIKLKGHRDPASESERERVWINVNLIISIEPHIYGSLIHTVDDNCYTIFQKPERIMDEIRNQRGRC